METQQTTAQKVMNTIEAKKVAPIAKWHFVFKNSGFWLLWGTSVVLGACATAATIFVFLNSGWRYYTITHDSFLRFLLDIVPFFWILALLSMVAFGYYNIRHTKRGYRFSFYLVVFSSVVASLLGGIILYALGIGSDIDNVRKPLPFSMPILSAEELYWNNKDRGLIAGFVTKIDSQKEKAEVSLLSGETELILTSELLSNDMAFLAPGAHVRIIGSRNTKGDFVACAILPFDNRFIAPKELFERKEQLFRTNVCRDARPYQKYKAIFITN